MKKNYLVKKLTAALLTGTMVLSMGGMTAFADLEGDNGGSTQSQQSTHMPVDLSNGKISFYKVITKDANVFTPNTDITFTVSPYEKRADEKLTDANGNVVYEGIANAIGSSGKAEFKSETTAADVAIEAGQVTATVDLTINPSKFTETVNGVEVFQPGIYRYVVEETDPTWGGVEAAKDTTYYLDVYVYSTTNVECVMYKKVTSEDKTTTTKIDTIQNTYDTSDLEVKKTVSGEQGSIGKEFTFYIDIDNASDTSKKYVLVQGDTKTVITANATPTEIKLKHNESVKIYGLSANDTYTIEESDYFGTDGYVTKITGADKVKKQTVNDGVLTDAADYTELTSGTEERARFAQGDVATRDQDGAITGTADETVTYNNEKSVSTPTGIAMTFAPYALMVVFAGGLAALFLRKKKEDF